MGTKLTRTDEEEFWLSIRRALLELVNVIEMCKLDACVSVSTSQVRKQLKSYQHGAYQHGVLTPDAECDKL